MFSQNFWVVYSLSILGLQWFDREDILSQYTPVIIAISILDISYKEKVEKLVKFWVHTQKFEFWVLIPVS